jgi:branched-chain amino acid transport system substrate-binding protein
MSRVALLIGVSRYPPGLNPLPKAQKDVEVMKRVLKQPKLQFEPPVCLSDRPLTEIQEAIETFFKRCHSDDQVIFLFSGYMIQEEDGRLYFATPETAPDEQGKLVKARSMPASFVQEAMNRSPAQHQVVILDCQFRQTFGNVPTAIETPVDLQTQLGGEGRVILTASAWTHHLTEPEDLDTWGYTRYLAEGIETGAADADSNGILTAADLHHYVKRKLKVAAPAMDPQLYGSEDMAKQPFLEVPIHDPSVRYRKVLEDLVEQGELDITASTLLTHRSLLDDVKYSLGLSPQEAAEIEFQTLQPVRDYRQRLQSYEEKFSGTTFGQNVSSSQNRLHLKQVQKALGLTDSDTAAIDAAPYVAEQQMQREQYQKNLASYEQILLAAMRRQFPLAEGDRHVLQRLEQALQLKAEDVQAVQTHLTAQMERQGDSPVPHSASQMETRAPVELDSNQTNLWSNPASKAFVPPPSSNAAPLEQIPKEDSLSPNREVPASYIRPETPFPPESSVRQSDPPPKATPPPPDVQPNNRPSPAKVSSPTKPSARSYTALIIPGVLLAAIIGTLAAMWSSSNLPKIFGSNSQTQESSTDSQTPLQQAAYYTNLGITAQGIGDLDAAIKYYNDAIGLLSKSCNQPADSNSNSPSTNPPANPPTNSSTECQVLARAYNNRSYAYFKQKDFSRALSDATQAVTLDSKLAEARINLANARFKQGDRPGALKDYDQALQFNLSNSLKAGVHNNRGNVYFAQNDTQAAIRDYDQAIKISSNYADAYYNRGLAYSNLKNSASAINDFQAAARYYRDKKDFKLADDAQKKASDLQQKGPDQTPLPPSENSTRG